MAFFNEIGAGRYNRFLQKFLNMKGGPPARSLSSDIAATWSLFHGAENRYLEGWYRYGSAMSIGAGGVGNQTVAALTNLISTNVIGVIEKILVAGQAADTVLVRGLFGTIPFPVANLATTVAAQPFDNRGRASAAIVPSNKNNTPAGASGATTLIGATTVNSLWDAIVTDIQEIPLLPNSQVLVAPSNLNEALFVSFFWRERALEDSEVQ